jgi:hypothetical protein
MGQQFITTTTFQKEIHTKAKETSISTFTTPVTTRPMAGVKTTISRNKMVPMTVASRSSTAMSMLPRYGTFISRGAKNYTLDQGINTSMSMSTNTFAKNTLPRNYGRNVTMFAENGSRFSSY